MYRHKESGLAMWYILAGVVLLAAVTFTFMRSMNTGTSTATIEKSRIVALKILRYAESLEQGVQELLLVNGCSERDISFYSVRWNTPADYDNTNTPEAAGDFNCHVFHPEGAGRSFQLPQGNDGSEYVVIGRLQVAGVGTDPAPAGSELLLILPNVDLGVCLAINRLLEVENPGGDPPQDAGGANYGPPYFNGSFGGGNQINGSELAGLKSACFEGDSSPPSGTYHFYHTLIAR